MKRKNKQIVNFSVVGLLALTAGGGISFMAFGGQGGNKTNIAFIGNNGQNWNDGGFNTNSHHAVEEYTNNNSNAKFKTDTYGAYSNDGSTYMDPTMKAFNQGDDIVVSSGFNFAGAIMGYDVYEDQNDPSTPDDPWDDTWVDHIQGIYGEPIEGSNYSENYGDKQVVLADDTLLASLYTNAVSINYMSQGGGFLAGLASAMYSTAWQISSPVTDDNLTNVVTCYGGLDMNVNYDYMSGFEQGVNYWNYIALGYGTTDSDNRGSELNVESLKPAKPTGEMNLLGNGTNTFNDANPIAPIEVAIPVATRSGTSGIHKMYYASDYYGSETTPRDTVTKIEDSPTNNWYIGGFPTTENDGPAMAAEAIRIWGVEDNIATIFPIAGASTLYTYRELASDKIHTKGKITQVIGVDSDPTLGDPKADEYILGSATKNLEMGIQYAIWAADYKQGETYVATDMNGEETVDPSGNIKDSTDFMKPLTPAKGDTPGWNYSADVNTDSDPLNDIPGQQFTGTIENGGSYFTPGNITNGSEGYELTDSLQIIKDESGKYEDVTLQDIADLSLAQNPVIEYHSHTFSSAYDENFPDVTVNYDEYNDEMPWLVQYNFEGNFKNNT